MNNIKRKIKLNRRFNLNLKLDKNIFTKNIPLSEKNKSKVNNSIINKTKDASLNIKESDVSKILTSMIDEDRMAFVTFLNEISNEDVKRAYKKYASKINHIEFTGQGSIAYYKPMSNSLYFSYPLDCQINNGQAKFSTICHEYGHFIDARGKFYGISHNEVDYLNMFLCLTKNIFELVPSSSDKFLEAVRKDKKRLLKLAIDIKVRDDLFSTDASIGVQDALDGMFGSKVKMRWQHGDLYYDRKYTEIKKFCLEKKIQEAYINLGFDVSNQSKVKKNVRIYETASEMWANIMSAVSCGGKELVYIKKYLTYSYEAYLDIMKGLK